MQRRDFLKMSMAQGLMTTFSPGKDPVSVRELLSRLTYTRQEIDIYLDSSNPNFAHFDPVLGYQRRTASMKNGVDGSRSFSTFAKTGERLMINFAGQPCRLNCYGDSFTEGSQVSDGETWEECLAAHLGEPVRNFGVGGYGVYQAYRRMLREEATPAAAKYIIFHIWGVDDHLRSIDAWRWLRLGESWRHMPGQPYMMQFTPWAHMRLDPNTGNPVEVENPYSTPQSLYKLCDKDYVYQAFHKDIAVQFAVAERMGSGYDLEQLKAAAALLKVPVDFRTPELAAESAHAIELEYGLQCSIYIVRKAREFAGRANKKLMVLLSYDDKEIIRACQGQPRPDPALMDYLKQTGMLFVDVRAKHLEDFKAFNLSPQDYVKRYYMGHYKPKGNQFFAFAVKDEVVDWLEPKPPAYR